MKFPTIQSTFAENGVVNMSRYIDAELLLEDNTYEWFDDWGNYTGAGLAVVNAPTADVVEVVHGEWVKPSEFSDPICNQCKQAPKTLFGVLPNYCPNCGAKMNRKKVE